MIEVLQRFMKELRPFQLKRLELLSSNHPVLLIGDCFLRSVSRNGTDFTFFDNEINDHSVIAWSYISASNEILCAHNADRNNYAIVYVTVDNELHPIDGKMQCLYASGLSPAELNVETRNGKAIRLSIPPNALVMYQ